MCSVVKVYKIESICIIAFIFKILCFIVCLLILSIRGPEPIKLFWVGGDIILR